MTHINLKDGEPCSHPGCLHHVTHPCEGCGRIAGRAIKNLGNPIVRRNLMEVENYSPYCGNISKNCNNPRTRFNGEQFECPCCGWVSQFPLEFIQEYKLKWGK